LKRIISASIFLIIAVAMIGFSLIHPTSADARSLATIPTFDVTSVTKDTNITIQTQNFPANVNFEVRMGKIGTRGVNGILVTTTNSGKGGSIGATYTIPIELKGLSQISVRLESKSTGFFSYNWFNNVTRGATATPVTPTATKTSIPGATLTPTRTPTKTTTPAATIPTFSIVSVEKDSRVTIKTANFPKNKKFDVQMGKMWTQGINGTLVTSIDSGSGETMTLTFDIPSGLKGLRQISIRLEDKTSGFFAYNWFWNN